MTLLRYVSAFGILIFEKSNDNLSQKVHFEVYAGPIQIQPKNMKTRVAVPILLYMSGMPVPYSVGQRVIGHVKIFALQIREKKERKMLRR